MRFISLNAGYFLGYNGTLEDYLRHPLRAFLGDSVVQSRRSERFNRLLEQTDPYAVFMQEVDQGSIRGSEDTAPEHLATQSSEDLEAFSSTKYTGLVGSLPFTGYMSNAVLYSEGKLKNHYLSVGMKSLVQELALDDFSVFSVHLARFGSSTRMEQIREIKEILADRDEFVLLGDFNFHNPTEREKASKILDTAPVSGGETFPAESPEKTLDLAFCSEGLEIEVEVLEKIISDHRPLIVEVEKA